MSGIVSPALVAAVALAVAAALVAPGRPGPRRLVRPPVRPWRRITRRPGRAISSREQALHRSAAVIASGGLLLLFDLPWGLPLGFLAFLAVPAVLARLEPAESRRRTERITANLPLAVDLLAACLRAGRPPGDAIATVGQGIGGPLAELLAEVERRLRLGADPDDAWGCLLPEPACAGFARAVQRALRSGAPLAATLEHLADDVRQERRWFAEERARAVETRSVVPLGLCFLPAFVLLGIVPTIAGSLTEVFSLVGG